MKNKLEFSGSISRNTHTEQMFYLILSSGELPLTADKLEGCGTGSIDQLAGE